MKNNKLRTKLDACRSSKPWRLPKVISVVAALLALGLAAQPLAAFARADAIGLGNLGTDGSGVGRSTATALNAAGQVAGTSYYYADGTLQGGRAFLWSNGSMTNLGSLGTYASGLGGSSAMALNAAGQVAGYSDYYAGGTYLGNGAFLWANGTMTNLGNLGTDASVYGGSNATALNPAGQVAGTSIYYVGGTYLGVRAVLWSNGGMTNLGSFGTDGSGVGTSNATALNASGQVAGNSNYYVGGTNLGGRAFLWSGSGMTNLGSLGTTASGYGSSTATALNAAGQVAGNSDYIVNGNNLLGRAFLWSNGSMTNLGSLGTNASGYGSSNATALNAAGQVAGTSDFWVGHTYQGSRAFLWSNGTMTNLGSFGTDAHGVGYSSATALNAAGQVAGSSVYYAGGTYVSQHAFLYNAGTLYDLNVLAPVGWTFENAVAINDWGQVAGDGNHSGNPEAFLVTPHPDWQGGNGSWADASRWNYGGMGAFGFSPGAPHDVAITPAASATVYGSADASVRSLTIGGNAGQVVTFNLNGGNTATSNGTLLNANGVIAGSGRLEGGLTTLTNSRIQVNAGESQQYGNGTLITNGEVRMLGSAANPASLESAGPTVNQGSGRYNLQNANLSFNGSLTNYGQVNVTFGNTNLSGNIANQGGGKIIVANGANASFWDSLLNNGELRVNGTANFFGQVSGAGQFTGSGTAAFEGGFAPGNSPAVVTVSFAATYGSGSTILMDLGGTAPGNLVGNHDKVIFNGPVTLQGGTLDVVWYGAYSGHAGDSFDLFDWNGGLSGSFGPVHLPSLDNGLTWRTQNLYTTGDISVMAVPEPETYAMLLAGLGVMGFLVRRRKTESLLPRSPFARSRVSHRTVTSQCRDPSIYSSR